ncbi:conserved hypothetical protein [methanotrophic bacterial endosymbiont of Bathymodiolus sp.]|nr:conserved hypothetical protein [methanotrophic bacterial endosymbiont of Bathymodiolus sp.]
MSSQKYGELAERPKAHAWKVCIRQRIKGSNPLLSAIKQKNRFSVAGFFMPDTHGYKPSRRYKRTGLFSFNPDISPHCFSLRPTLKILET